jgi:hypothetical protein
MEESNDKHGGEVGNCREAAIYTKQLLWVERVSSIGGEYGCRNKTAVGVKIEKLTIVLFETNPGHATSAAKVR